MKYLYDVWVNWFEGEEYGFNVYQYHEWRKNDQIDILEQVPVIYITEALYDYIENSLHDLPEELLEKIYKRAYVRKGVSRRVLDYACIISDGRKILAVNTVGYHIPLQKSRLIPRQERQVLEYCEETEPNYIPFTKIEEDSAYTLYKLKEHQIFGLTRREKQLKKLLLIALDKLKQTDNRNEVLYWLAEWDVQMVQTVSTGATIEDVWNILFEAVQVGWHEAHERLCAQIVKGNPFLEKYWEVENEHSHNPSHK